MVITSQCHQNILFQIRKVVTQIVKTNNCTDHFTEQGEVAEAVDNKTEHWPVPPHLHEELNKIKFEYRTVPLPVYVNKFFMELAHINNCIKGALVELHFKLHHFTIQMKIQDSFNTTIEQIVVLHHHDKTPSNSLQEEEPTGRSSPGESTYVHSEKNHQRSLQIWRTSHQWDQQGAQ